MEYLDIGQSRGLRFVGMLNNKEAQSAIGGLISHAFFRPYSLTRNFDGMRFFLKRQN